MPSAEPRPAAKVKVRDENDAATQPVSGPSFLGLADEPSEPVSYLLEDEPGGSNGARLFFVVLLLGCFAAAGWHWRGTIRGLVEQARQQTSSPASPTSQTTSYKTAPISTAGSEVAGSMPNAQAVTETPQSEGSSQPTTPQPDAAQSTTNQPAASSATTQTSGNIPQQANTTQPQSGQANSGGTQAPASAGTPANGVSTKQDDSSTQNSGSSQSTRASQSAATKKSSKVRDDSTAQDAGNDAANQALEATGEKYLYGNGAPQSCSMAQKNLLAAAESSNSRAASVLGTMYATGHCVTRDLPLAYFWFAKAMQQEPNNARLEHDLTAVWNEMTPDERQVAIHHR